MATSADLRAEPKPVVEPVAGHIDNSPSPSPMPAEPTGKSPIKAARYGSLVVFLAYLGIGIAQLASNTDGVSDPLSLAQLIKHLLFPVVLAVPTVSAFFALGSNRPKLARISLFFNRTSLLFGASIVLAGLVVGLFWGGPVLLATYAVVAVFMAFVGIFLQANVKALRWQLIHRMDGDVASTVEREGGFRSWARPLLAVIGLWVLIAMAVGVDYMINKRQQDSAQEGNHPVAPFASTHSPTSASSSVAPLVSPPADTVSAPASQAQVASATEEAQALAAVPTDEHCAAAIAALPSDLKSMSYGKARAELLLHGFKPLPRSEDPENPPDGTAADYVALGYTEVDSCTGGGQLACNLLFSSPAGLRLTVLTAGEYMAPETAADMAVVNASLKDCQLAGIHDRADVAHLRTAPVATEPLTLEARKSYLANVFREYKGKPRILVDQILAQDGFSPTAKDPTSSCGTVGCNCGNAGCTYPWVDTKSALKLCVGTEYTEYNDSTETEGKESVVAINPGSCDN